MRASVVINTYNREASLSKTLDGLRHQTHPDFEVIVVNGPSTDGTKKLLSSWSKSIRIEECPERVLGKSRNVGIRAAAGEVVAFIDDDAVPEPDWLETLVAAYDDPRVGGVGGIVFDRTGTRLQYLYALCYRTGLHVLDAEPPFDAFQGPGADPIVYLQGTNCSFRRSYLEEVGGFDEELVCVYDDVDVSLRLNDAGYLIKLLFGAAVHHKHLASHVRDAAGTPTDPYPKNRDRAYFAFKHATDRSSAQLNKQLAEHVESVVLLSSTLMSQGALTAEERNAMIASAEKGLADGRRTAREYRSAAHVGPPRHESFKAFPTLQPEGGRIRVAFVSGEYPPGYSGGIGRFTQDLATGLAQIGHEVHVIAPSPDSYTVNVEEGVWVHRLKIQDRDIPGLDRSPLKQTWLNIAALYHEVLSVHERRPLDIVSAPLWNCEALMPCLDPRFPTAMALTTTFRTIAGIHPSWDASPNVRARLGLERMTAPQSTYRHAISQAILEDVDEHYGPLPGWSKLIPLGVRDRAPRFSGSQGDPDHLNLLFVGRLERRKGVDLLLQIVPDLLAEFPNLNVQLVGQDTLNTELGEGYKERFLREHSHMPEVTNRVSFRGLVDEASLYEAYAKCDVFCAPSRFESLGLVLLEAMMMGKPVVATEIGGMKEIVKGNGILVEPESSFGLLCALRKLLSDQGLRIEMGNRSRELFESFWSLDKAVDRTVLGYREFVDHHRSSPERRSDEKTFVARLSSTIAEAENLSTPDSIKVATALADRACYPVDQKTFLRAIWHYSDDEFIESLYELFLNRAPDVAGFHVHLSNLSAGANRTHVVRTFAFSPEARRRGLDHSWLADIESWEAPSARDSRRLGKAPTIVGRVFWRLKRSYQAVRNLTNLEIVLGDADTRLLHQIDRRLIAERAHAGLRFEEAATRISRVESTLFAEGERTAKQGQSIEDLLQELEGRVDRVGRIGKAVGDRVGRVGKALDEQVEGVERGLTGRVEKVEQQVISRFEGVGQALGDQVGRAGEAMAERVAGVEQALGKSAQDQIGLSRWISLLQVKLEALSLDLRDRLPVQPSKEDLPEPVIQDRKSYSRLVGSMEGGLLVNLGCGEKPLPGYVNVDFRRLPGVDVVADIRRLPFDPASVAELSSSHLVEHFRTHHFATVILPYWCSLLRRKGRIRIVCPNAEELINRAGAGQMPLEDFRTTMFGLQDYSGDDHLSMYSPALLKSLLKGAGFGQIKIIEEARQNGLCPELEIVAAYLGPPKLKGKSLRAEGKLDE